MTLRQYFLTTGAASIVAVLLPINGFATEVSPPGCDEAPLRAGGSYAFTRQIDRETTLPEHLTIHTVYITSLPVFDLENPDENNAIYRFANRWHVNTKTHRIAQKLLFETGDAFNARIIDESARNLRDEKFLYDADVRPVKVCDATVDVEVITRDVWSFTPEVTYKRTGGDSEYRLGVRDTNVLGSGQQLALMFKHDLDRDSMEFRYRDKNFRGSRKEARLSVADNDDGWRQAARLERPLYSLDTRTAWGASLERYKRTDTQFFRSEDISEVEHREQEYHLQYGWSKGLKNGKASRWSAGYWFRQDEFEAGSELLPPVNFPTDRKLSYPFIVFVQEEDKYDTAMNYDQLRRTEDLYLGQNVYAKLGLAAEAFGSDTDRLVTTGTLTRTLAYNGDYWLTHQLEWEGLYNLETHNSEDVLVDYQVRYFRPQTRHRSFFASLQTTYSHNLNSNKGIYLGGKTGA